MTADREEADPFSGDALLNEFKARWRPLVFLLSGPSGVGKDSVVERLQRPNGQGGIDGLKVVVTATTRERRPGEMDLVHYEFLTREDFLDKIDQGYFVENATVYGPGNLYGVPRHQIMSPLAAGLNPVVKIDVQGAASLKQLVPQSVSIFLAPESIEALQTVNRFVEGTPMPRVSQETIDHILYSNPLDHWWHGGFPG